MTPKVWHGISLKVEPHKSRLIRVALASLFVVVVMFILGFRLQEYNKWHFLGLWISMVSLFWCFGLLLVNQMYKKLPNRENLVGIAYCWNLIMSWYGAVFIALWFFGLVLATVVAPIFIMFTKSN